jgi:ribonuclease PH
VALHDAVQGLLEGAKLSQDPLTGQIAAVSVGIYQGVPVLDLDYTEDSSAHTDMNVVMNADGRFVEVQGTAEGVPFDRDQMNALLDLAAAGIGEILAAQRDARQA